VAWASDVCPASIDLGVGDKVIDCPRIGLREDVAKTTQLQLIERDYLVKEVAEQKNLIDLKDLTIQNSQKQVDLFKADSDREREAYDKERSRGDTKFWVGLGLGALTIIAGAWAVKQVAR